MSRKKITVFILSLLMLFSCSKNYIIEDNLPSLKGKKIAVLQPLTFQNVFNYNDDEAFDKNVFIGTINFQGGIINDASTDYIVKTRIKSYDNQTEFQNSITTLFIDSITGILTKEKRDYIMINADPKIGQTDILKKDNFRVSEDETKTEDYRTDNMNFPRIIYALQGIDKNAAAIIKEKYKVSFIIIPLVEYYYIHNSGWFNGRISGCTSGYRARLHLYFIDTETNTIVFSFKNDEKRIYAFKYIYDKYDLKEWHKELNSELQKTLANITP